MSRGSQKNTPLPTSAAAAKLTPAMQQYHRFKQRHPDCVLFFRMGDFYEMFHDDALTAHKALGITLTERTPGVPMAGVPYHAVEGYLRRMIEQGFRVAVCEQVQDPKEAKGVVDRAVTRVVTPGTLVDDALLRDDAPNNLACVCFLDAGDAADVRTALAVVELSTGAFTVMDLPAHAALDEMVRRGVNEMLYADAGGGDPPVRVKRMLEALSAPGTPRPQWHFRRGEALEAIQGQWGVATLAGFGLDEDDPALPAAGAALRYLLETQEVEGGDPKRTAAAGAARRALAHLSPPKRENPAGFLVLDAASLRSLEIERTIRASGRPSGGVGGNGGAGGAAAGGAIGSREDSSLLGVFLAGRGGGCRTSMGKRLLRDWLTRPLCDRAAIEARQSSVATLVEDARTAAALAEAIRRVQDVARIAGRLGLGRATPRDLVALGASLESLDAIAEAIQNAPAFARSREALLALRGALAPVAEEIARSCIDHPPSHMREGGLIRDGVDAELDEARLLQRDGASWLASYQERMIREHALPGIKVGYNKVFGYYIELTASQARKAPDVFARKQTLKNAERYTTPELKEFEDKVTTAESRAIEREQALFLALCAKAAAEAAAIGRFAHIVAELDALLCFAGHAAAEGWARPAIVDEPVLDIAQGRHPVLEILLGENFVPNDARLGAGAAAADTGEASADAPAADSTAGRASLALITGPNMAGKSTFIRQTALITLLAHTGSFVPAERAVIGLTDRIFTRIGADDALHAGQSTFMVEMTETANILHHATGRSLVILDEIGRGTSTLDGLSLAWGIAERLAGAEDAAQGSVSTRFRGGPRTLFATHYHELTALEDRLPGRVKNLHVSVREWGEQIVFLHRILPGRTDRSYGIHVAKLAGLPREVVARAQQVLESLSVSHGGDEFDGGGSGGALHSAADPSRPAGARPGRARDRAHATDRIPGADRAHPRAPGAAPAGQLGLFTEYVNHPVVEELKGLDLTKMTPMEAFDALRRLAASVRDAR